MDSGNGTASAPWAVEEAPQEPLTLGLRKQLLREEWEELKPLIRRLYIEEGRTFAYIADVLCETHNFKPTKKQFDDRIKKWEFRKNTKESERKSILQNVKTLRESVEVEISGRKHKRQKLERWQRELERDHTFYSLSAPPEEPQAPVNSTRNPEPVASTTAIEDEPLIAMDLDPDPVPLGRESEKPPAVYEEDPWPFDRWVNVDVIGSPKLTRLFENLKIESGDLPDDIEALILLPLSCPSVTQEEEQYITGQELTMVHYGENSSTESWSNASMSLPTILIQKHESTRVGRQANWSPFKVPSSDTWFPSGAQVQRIPSPFNELYPFPTRSPKAARGTVKLTQSFQPNDVKPQVLLSRLKHAGFAENHPGVLRVKWRLANTYWDLGRYNQAESLHKILLLAYQELVGADSITVVFLKVRLAQCMVFQSKITEAKKLLDEASSAIIYGPHHELMLGFLRVRHWFMYYAEDFEGAENTCRQLIQMNLAAFGPKSAHTAAALRNLGTAMRKRTIYDESEKLHRVALQLYQGSTGLHEGFFDALRELAGTFVAQNRFEEATRLCWLAREKLKESLGDENPRTLTNGSRLGRLLRKQNILQESEEILSTTVRVQIKILGEDEPDTLGTMDELGRTLYQRGKYEEAGTWFERSFRRRLKVLGPHGYTVATCDWLGRAYEGQGRYKDALALYNELVENIRLAKGDSHVGIAKIQLWIDDVHEILAARNEGDEEVGTDEEAGWDG